jgi:hypothetical protein
VVAGMTADGLSKNYSQIQSPISQDLFAALAFVAVIALRLVAYHMQHGSIFLEDDAYYYRVIAENLATTGHSTFDGQTLTNGYHPLWLLVMTLQFMLLGSSALITVALEVLLAGAGLLFVLVSFRNTSLLFRTLFATLYTLLAWPMVAKGMEVSLLFLGFGLFTHTLIGYVEGRRSAYVLGSTALLCIGARIDSAAFVVPAMLLAAPSLRHAALSLAPIAIGGAIYTGVNQYVFGLMVPVSGAIKSLGGLQLNAALLAQVGDSLPYPLSAKSIATFANGTLGRPLLLAVLALFAVPFAPRNRRSLVLATAYVIGLLAYDAKLFFASSWVVWPWYGFPAIFGVIAVFVAIDQWIEDSAVSLPTWLQAVASVILIGLLAAQQYAGSKRSLAAFEPLNRKAALQFSLELDGARVAMGDRAGSFAAAYRGPVTQLEGLVNDREYLKALESNKDIKPLLCARGVSYVLAYQLDLGTYDSVSIPMVRRRLTSFPGPELKFTRAQQVGQIADASLFNNASNDDGDSHIYAWRLDCGAQ